MKKHVCRILAGFLILALTVTLVPVVIPPQEAQAAVKISAATKTLVVEGKATLKVSGTTKKVTWSSSNKAVATVSSKGKVTAKKAGTATINGKVGSKTYSCKVTVISKATATKNIKVTYKKTDSSLICIVKNNNKCDVALEPQVKFYNKSKKKVAEYETEIPILAAGKSAAFECRDGEDSSGDPLPAYASYKMDLDLDAPEVTNRLKNVTVTSTLSGANAVNATFENTGSSVIDFCMVSIIYYKGGKAVGFKDVSISIAQPGTKTQETFMATNHPSTDTMSSFDDYKLYISYAYQQ